MSAMHIPLIPTDLRWDHTASPFPKELEHLGQVCASIAGFEMRGEAAIINYYKSDKSTMGGHVDDSEDAMDRPLVSISLGESALFLITPTRKETPLALMVHSGDVIVMGGKSRTCIHGVPRIFNRTFQPSLDVDTCQPSIVDCNNPAKLVFPEKLLSSDGKEKRQSAESDNDRLETISFMQGRRINVSIRQVF